MGWVRQTRMARYRSATTIRRSPTSAYFAHVDWIVAKANSLGLYIGFLPTWGDKWNKKWGQGPEIFTVENAERYGEWLGRRYRDAGLVWILGGDRPVESRFATRHHPRAGPRSSARRRGPAPHDLPSDRRPWVRRVLPYATTGSTSTCVRTATASEYTGHYDQTRVDYDRTPTKPVIDGEPIYEDHPISFDAKKFGHSIASDVRRPLLLGPLRRRVRPHLRQSRRLADVDARAGAHQQSAHAVDGGDRAARRRCRCSTRGRSSSRGRS